MSTRDLRLIGDPVLRTECDLIVRFGPAVDRLIDDLMDTVLLPGRAGLAAPQIGVSLAAFSYNIEGRHGYLLNPVVQAVSGEYGGSEGCLSIPGLRAHTERAWHTVVTGFDRHGEPVTVEGTGEMSRCLQHETDHLRGKLFLDRLSGDDRAAALRALRSRRAPGAPGQNAPPGLGAPGLRPPSRQP